MKSLGMKSLRKSARLLSVLAVCLVSMATSTAGRAAFIDDIKTDYAAVLVGPCGLPGAMGPSGVNDDFTNRSVDTGIANVGPGGLTVAEGTAVFRNTVQNMGSADDAFIVTAPLSPRGFKIEISTDDGDHYVAVEPWSTSVTIAVAYHAAATFFVRVTAPAGVPVLTGFDTVLRVTSTVNPTVTNDTIDRLYTGFVRIDRTATAINADGSGGANVAVPGSEIEFTINYSNISSALGVGSSPLTAYNLVINENGFSAPNNWGATTDHVVGASDSQAGIILGDRIGSTALTDMVMTLAAGQSGVFKFRRRVK
jgi:hypothetical protein